MTTRSNSLALLRLLRAIFYLCSVFIKGPSKKKQPRRASSVPNDTQAAVLAQFHAAEYAAERSSVDVWKTLQYAMVPIMFGAWYLLSQVREYLTDIGFSWACAAVLPLCFVAYQKAMVDALTGVLLIEERVRPLATRLAGTDEFWFHEPVYRKDVPPDSAYGWYWPPLLSFLSPYAMLAYRIYAGHLLSSWSLWMELAGYVICCLIAWGVGFLSKRGLALNRQINEAIKNTQLSWLQRKEST